MGGPVETTDEPVSGASGTPDQKNLPDWHQMDEPGDENARNHKGSRLRRQRRCSLQGGIAESNLF